MKAIFYPFECVKFIPCESVLKKLDVKDVRKRGDNGKISRREWKRKMYESVNS